LSTEQRILRSTFAGYAIQLARLLVGFVAKLALARLVLPEGHGLYEEALRIVTIASAVRDLTAGAPTARSWSRRSSSAS
jgi:O-antigen/teichoic acid export membrane protein